MGKQFNILTRTHPLLPPTKYAMVPQHGLFSLHTMLDGPWLHKTTFPNTHSTAFGWESRVLTITRSQHLAHVWSGPKGHVTHKTESPWPLHFKHSHWWKRRSRSKFTSHYAWGTNGVCECKMDVKSTCIPTWHPMHHVSWLLGLFWKTTSWK
jgi:hypothetical protein